VRVLVTGGSGFVGAATVRELRLRGHELWATSTRPQPDAPGVHWLEWDACAQPLPAAPWGDLDAVLHLAVPRSFAFPDAAAAMFEVTVAATARLLARVAAGGAARFVLASTGDVLGPATPPALESDCDYRPTSFYGAAKASAELLARAYAGALPVAIARIFHPYGPGGDRFLVNRLAARVAAGEPVRVEGADGIPLNPLWIDDLAAGLAAVVERDATGIFHFAGPETLTLRALIERLGALLGVEPRIEPQLDRAPAASHAGDCARSAALLGFAPRTGLAAGLASLVAGPPRP
jgi:nucleoside-diphosphate-sugar epimerase